MRALNPVYTIFKITKVQVLCLHFFIFSNFLFCQKQFEVSINIGKSNSWAIPSQSKYLFYSKNNSAVTQYVNFKMLYTVKPFLQTGICYNSGNNSFNFVFFDKTQTRASNTFGGKSLYYSPFHQIFIPAQINFFNKLVAEPYLGLAATFSFQHKNTGIEYDSEYGNREDTISWELTYEPLKSKSIGYLSYLGMKVHLFKHFIFKIEVGYSNTQKVFGKATLDYNYNGLDFRNIDFKMHNSFTYNSIGISYTFNLKKGKLKD